VGLKTNLFEMNQELKHLCKEENIKKFEDAVFEESEVLVNLTKKHFWNDIILIGFFSYLFLYLLYSDNPQKPIIVVASIAVLLASFERFYIQRKIKSKVSKLATFSAIIEFLKNVKHESTSSR
jgi:hypothetical protein